MWKKRSSSTKRTKLMARLAVQTAKHRNSKRREKEYGCHVFTYFIEKLRRSASLGFQIMLHVSMKDTAVPESTTYNRGQEFIQKLGNEHEKNMKTIDQSPTKKILAWQKRKRHTLDACYWLVVRVQFLERQHYASFLTSTRSTHHPCIFITRFAIRKY